MTNIVVDASVALAWCFPDEASAYADQVLIALEGSTILVPAVWTLEITNAVVVAERRKRIRPLEVRRFLELLGNLAIVSHAQTVADTVSHVRPLAQAYDLSAYDAAYLDLAIRQAVPLATLDNKLRAAARAAGVQIFKG